MLLGPKAQTHADSADTVKFVNAHCESPYFPKVPIMAVGILQINKYRFIFSHNYMKIVYLHRESSV